MAINMLEYRFEGPFPDPTHLRNEPGVYAVLCERASGVYLIDIGESERVRDRVQRHERAACWDRECAASMRFGAYYAPDADQQVRREIEARIRRELRPPCGDR